MEKLGQLCATGRWDLIVVDTPPSRSALDFLDAPQRLSRFLDGRMIRVLLAPARAGGRAYFKVVGASFGMFSRVVGKVLGTALLHDLSAFVAALDTMFGGFRERAQATYDLLKMPGTAFLVISTPEPDALREASYFVSRLDSDVMPLAGLVLNRVHATGADGLTAERSLAAAETLEQSGEASPVAAGVLRVHAERIRLAQREQRLRARFTSAHPQVAVAQIPAQAGDVHDLRGLRRVGRELAAGAAGD